MSRGALLALVALGLAATAAAGELPGPDSSSRSQGLVLDSPPPPSHIAPASPAVTPTPVSPALGSTPTPRDRLLRETLEEGHIRREGTVRDLERYRERLLYEDHQRDLGIDPTAGDTAARLRELQERQQRDLRLRALERDLRLRELTDPTQRRDPLP